MKARIRMVPGLWGRLQPAPDRSDDSIDRQAQALLDQMTFDEKIHQMSGDMPFLTGGIEMVQSYNTRPYPAGENFRLGIPGVRFTDGPRGVVVYHSTCFPVAMARGATWDPDLEARIGDAIGVEARTQGANFFGGVCINLLRHPAWGRAQETYGEDPYLLGEMGAALVRGVQRHVMACVKHFACNSIENARFKVDVQVDERTLREVYLPHFKRCVDEGAAAVMSAYNRLNGTYCGHNRPLLRDILKTEWGFRGFVMSDFVFGVRGPSAAAAGLDIEMPFTIRFGRWLKRAIRRGKVPMSAIDEAVLRLLRQKIRFAAIGEPERYRPEVVAGEAHRALAREAARQAMVLLKNDPPAGAEAPLLPLDLGRIERLAVIGALADAANLGDRGSSQVRPPEAVTPLAGLRAQAGGKAALTYHPGEDVAGAAEAARGADAAIVVAGYTYRDEGEFMNMPFRAGEGGDRASLTLSAHDEALIQAVAAANPRTVVVLIGGSAIITEAWRARVPAILMAWYAGMEGGHALADLLFGAANPAGRLPCTFPRSAAHLPFFDANANAIRYDYFHGYWRLDRDGHAPAFPFGFGLSYTTFAYADLALGAAAVGPEEALEVSVSVTNTGPRAGAEVVQLYAGHLESAVERPIRALKGFQKIVLEPGESRRVTLTLPARALAIYDPATGGWRVEPGRCRVEVGPYADAAVLLAGEFTIRE